MIVSERPWWQRLDGAPSWWQNRPAVDRSGATAPDGHSYYLVARGRGVIDWIPGFKDPGVFAIWASWVTHWMAHPGQWLVDIEDRTGSKPQRVYRSEVLKSRSEAVARLRQLKEKIESGDLPF